MLSFHWTDLLRLVRKMTKEDPHTFDAVFEALERLRCLTVLWGLEYPENVRFQNTEDKRHTLLAYKHLEVLWFAELPVADDSGFELLIRGGIPRSATPDKVLDTFSQSNATLDQWCNNIGKPTWIDPETGSMRTSLASFPREVVS